MAQPDAGGYLVLVQRRITVIEWMRSEWATHGRSAQEHLLTAQVKAGRTAVAADQVAALVAGVARVVVVADAGPLVVGIRRLRLAAAAAGRIVVRRFDQRLDNLTSGESYNRGLSDSMLMAVLYSHASCRHSSPNRIRFSRRCWAPDWTCCLVCCGGRCPSGVWEAGGRQS